MGQPFSAPTSPFLPPPRGPQTLQPQNVFPMHERCMYGPCHHLSHAPAFELTRAGRGDPWAGAPHIARAPWPTSLHPSPLRNAASVPRAQAARWSGFCFPLLHPLRWHLTETDPSCPLKGPSVWGWGRAHWPGAWETTGGVLAQTPLSQGLLASCPMFPGPDFLTEERAALGVKSEKPPLPTSPGKAPCVCLAHLTMPGG